jgi:hypothetical protein
MRHANEIPVSIDLYQEFRSYEFQQAYGFVLRSLASDHDPSLGISGLPEEARFPSVKVASFFTSVGGLVCLGLVDERFAVSMLGTSAHRVWDILEPYIRHERGIRGDDDVLAFFEDFVCRTRDNYPPSRAYGLKFRKLANGARDKSSEIPSPSDRGSILLVVGPEIVYIGWTRPRCHPPWAQAVVSCTVRHNARSRRHGTHRHAVRG